MSFASDIKRFVVKVERRNRAVYVGIANAVHASIVRGSPITGAPGQPVDTGFLLGSWKLNIGKEQATVATNVAYARVIEDNNRAAYDDKGVKRPKREGPGGSTNVRNLAFGATGGQIGPAEGGDRVTIRSKVGGHHSVKLTIAGASLLQNAVLRELGDA